MAIKTVSLLNPYNTNGVNWGSVGQISTTLVFFADGFLTTEDKACAQALNPEVTTRSNTDYANGANKLKNGNVLSTNDETFWSSLFEISKPASPSKNNPGIQQVYNSYNIQYEDLLKTILFDVKSYLNWRNNLNDYNLSTIVDNDQMFRGNKYLIGGLSVSNALCSYALTAHDAWLSNIHNQNLTSQNGNITNLTTQTVAADGLTANNLSVHTSLSLDCNISTSTNSLVFDGWSFGLVNREGTVISDYGDINTSSLIGNAIPGSWVSCGTYDSIQSDPKYHGLSEKNNRCGDPVCFVNGRPYELTCVNRALSAHIIVDPNSGAWNVGTAGLISTLGGYELPGQESGISGQYTVVKFVDGKPTACNEIDFAHHALWSDLGERYLADAYYEPGTLVKFGGEKEITIADNEVNAIVSTKAFDLNAQLVGGTVIALCGRVPTKVKGKIQKFDKIMLSDTPGVACKWDGTVHAIGRALESNDDEGIKLVECVTRFEV